MVVSKGKAIAATSLVLLLLAGLAGWYLLASCSTEAMTCRALSGVSWYLFPLQLGVFADAIADQFYGGSVRAWWVFVLLALPACVAMAYGWHRLRVWQFTAAYVVACAVAYFASVQILVWELAPIPASAEASEQAFMTPHCVAVDQKPQDVGIGELRAHPDQFEGRMVRVQGYYYNGFEISTILPTHADPYGNAGNGLWVTGLPVFNQLSGRRVWMVGVFTQHERGHLGQWPGEICVNSAGVVT
jgi:hypothetical protein